MAKEKKTKVTHSPGVPALHLVISQAIRHGAIEEQRRLRSALLPPPGQLGPPQEQFGPLGPPQPQGPPLLGVMAAQQAQQLGAISAMQQAQLAQLAAAQGADQRVMTLVAAQQQQQIAALAAAMQEQLNQLARSVQQLGGGRDDDAAALMRKSLSSQMPGRQQNALPTPRQLLGAEGMRAVDGAAAARLFSGSNTGPRLQLGEGHPSRATRAQLHLSGADAALPADVRLALEGRVPPPAVTNPDLDLEGRDVRLVNDVMIHVLALRRVDALNVPPRLRSVYLTFQLFDFPPTITPPARLDGGERAPAVCMLQPERTQGGFLGGGNNGNAPGLLFKYRVAPEEGDDPAAAQEGRMAFCRYLAKGTLAVDVWDAESLLQLGTAAIDIRQLLRQARVLRAEEEEDVPTHPLTMQRISVRWTDGALPAGLTSLSLCFLSFPQLLPTRTGEGYGGVPAGVSRAGPQGGSPGGGVEEPPAARGAARPGGHHRPGRHGGAAAGGARDAARAADQRRAHLGQHPARAAADGAGRSGGHRPRRAAAARARAQRPRRRHRRRLRPAAVDPRPVEAGAGPGERGAGPEEPRGRPLGAVRRRGAAPAADGARKRPHCGVCFPPLTAPLSSAHCSHHSITPFSSHMVFPFRSVRPCPCPCPCPYPQERLKEIRGERDKPLGPEELRLVVREKARKSAHSTRPGAHRPEIY